MCSTPKYACKFSLKHEDYYTEESIVNGAILIADSL